MVSLDSDASAGPVAPSQSVDRPAQGVGRADGDALGAPQAVAMRKPPFVAMLGDRQTHRATLFAETARAAAPRIDRQSLLAAPDRVLHRPDRAEGAPGARMDQDRERDPDRRRHQAHRPEDPTPMKRIRGIERNPIHHEPHQCPEDDPTEERRSQPTRDGSPPAERRRQSIVEGSPRAEVAADVAPAGERADHSNDHHDRHRESQPWNPPAKHQGHDDDTQDEPLDRAAACHNRHRSIPSCTTHDFPLARNCDAARQRQAASDDQRPPEPLGLSSTSGIISTADYPSRITTPTSASATPHSRHPALTVVALFMIHLHLGGFAPQGIAVDGDHRDSGP